MKSEVVYYTWLQTGSEFSLLVATREPGLAFRVARDPELLRSIPEGEPRLVRSHLPRQKPVGRALAKVGSLLVTRAELSLELPRRSVPVEEGRRHFCPTACEYLELATEAADRGERPYTVQTWLKYTGRDGRWGARTYRTLARVLYRAQRAGTVEVVISRGGSGAYIWSDELRAKLANGKS